MEGLRFILPEPPSLNHMLDLAGMVEHKRAYSGAQKTWRRRARLLLPPLPASAPWEQWAITRLHFSLFNPRDPLELAAGAKWAADLLISEGFVVDDGPDFLVGIPYPTQDVQRKRRHLVMDIERRG